ncbi:hypothetical protein [Streptomyces qinglanensis]|uniref:hypothetical protein n=1 Tax=Streptomyces qinglanensis TaxID=943816 RepID=UPI0037BB8C2C
MSGDRKGAYDGPKPGDGYAIEIAGVRKILKPLEESVIAARKIKDVVGCEATFTSTAGVGVTMDTDDPARH